MWTAIIKSSCGRNRSAVLRVAFPRLICKETDTAAATSASRLRRLADEDPRAATDDPACRLQRTCHETASRTLDLNFV